MPEDQCIKLPPSLPFNEAASMALVYDTAYFALKDRGRIAPGETVLVLGATGGVGLAAIQLAKAMGGKVLAAVASKDKEDIVRAAGADAIVDLSVAGSAREPAPAGVRADRQEGRATSSSTCWAATSSTPRCARWPGAAG